MNTRRNQWLAVLGYWVPESDGMRFGAILLRSLSQLAVDQGPVLLEKPETHPRSGGCGRRRITAHQAQGRGWRN